jgi:hypothetical protein
MKEKFGCRKVVDGNACRKEIWRNDLCDWWDNPYCEACESNIPIKVKPMQWIKMKENPPVEDMEILFVADEDITDERIGIACPESRVVILKRTDMSFDDVKYWIPIPEIPEE